MTIEIGRAGAALRGVAGDGRAAYAEMVSDTISVVEAYRGGVKTWTAQLAGTGGALAAGSGLVFAATAVRGEHVRGDPGALVVALDAASGAVRWQVALDSTQWVHASALAAEPADGGVIVGGAFTGSLRVADRVVASGGDSDGFVARLDSKGKVAWLVRTGGTYADAVQGVAAHGDTVAIAGVFTTGAELLGEPLPAFDPRSPLQDAFVAALDANGGKKWVSTFGGRATEAVGGVAIDARGHVTVAATVRDEIHIGSSVVTAQGAADGLVLSLGADGEKGPAELIGGADFDGATAITAAGDRVVIAGFFSGKLPLGARTLSAGGGDDSYIALLDPAGMVVNSWQVGGEGREEVVALAPIPGGFVAGITHTASATIDGGPTLPAPADPMTGAALVVRGF